MACTYLADQSSGLINHMQVAQIASETHPVVCVSTRRLHGLSSLIAILAYPQSTVVDALLMNIVIICVWKSVVNYGYLLFTLLEYKFMILILTSLLLYTHITRVHRLVISFMQNKLDTVQSNLNQQFFLVSIPDSNRIQRRCIFL